MLGRLESQGMTFANKLRLISIFIIAQHGITEEVRRQIVQAAGASRGQPCRLPAMLGVPLRPHTA
jgi:hypothetical protein